MMFKKVDKKMIKRCTDALEFYDNNGGHFPWEKKKNNLNKNSKNKTFK